MEVEETRKSEFCLTPEGSETSLLHRFASIELNLGVHRLLPMVLCYLELLICFFFL